MDPIELKVRTSFYTMLATFKAGLEQLRTLETTDPRELAMIDSIIQGNIIVNEALLRFIDNHFETINDYEQAMASLTHRLDQLDGKIETLGERQKIIREMMNKN
jgi:hypothetical protein